MYDWPSHHMWGMHMGWWLLCALLIILLLLILLRAFRPPTETQPHRTPAQILEERYAAGEISTQQYQERRRQLARQ